MKRFGILAALFVAALLFPIPGFSGGTSKFLNNRTGSRGPNFRVVARTGAEPVLQGGVDSQRLNGSFSKETLSVIAAMSEPGQDRAAEEINGRIDRVYTKSAEVGDGEGLVTAAIPSQPGASDDKVKPASLAAATPKGPTGYVAAYVLDLDGNVFGKGFPTKIILFKKNGPQEHPISTADFAVIESKIGTDFVYDGINLQDYEISGERGSFRNFKGRQLVADLKYAIEKLPKSEWQGPSWHAMIHALNDPETAPFVHVITAREHSSQELLEAFEYLQSVGYIKHLPKIENLYAVGSATDVPGRKVELMSAIVDRLQATEFGDDASKIINADGTAKATLHTVGFSDDTWANFEKMRDALAAAIREKPSRWKKVKIVLFYTGTNNPDHEPGAVVLKSDGTARALTIDEHNEAFVRHLEAPGAHATPRYKPLPKPTEVRSTLTTVGDAIKKMFVSHAYGNTDANVVDSDDLVARERRAIEGFIADKSLPNERKHVILTRYSIEDVPLARTLVAALKAGIRVDLITDFNVSMDYALKDGETMIVDFSRATFKTSEPGRFIQILLDGGFEIVGNNSTNEPRGAIYSQPLYNKGDTSIDPIMHEKNLLLVSEPSAGAQDKRKVLDYYFGTANLTTHPRYNRVFQLQEELSMIYGLDHADKIMAAFRAGKAITEIVSEPPYRVWFEDESFMEAAYTNGKYNPNDRIVEVLQRAKLKKAWLSHFVLTNGNVVGAFKDAMKANPLATIFGIFDDKFVPVTGYGKAAILSGFMTAPKFGKSSWGWAADFARRTRMFDYLRGVDGQIEIDMDGPPLARHLWHDKTSLLLVEEDGKEWYYLFTGSLNNSNHVENAELQFMFRLPADSTWAKAVIDSIEKTVAAEKEYAVAMEFGVLRDAIASVASLSPLYVKTETVDAVVKAAVSRDAGDISAKFTELVASGTQLIGEKFLPKKAVEGFKRFLEFINWYNKERDENRIKSPLNIRKLVALATVIANPGLKAYVLKSELNQVLWEKNIKDLELERRIGSAWELLHIEQAMPAQREDREAEPAQPAAAPKEKGPVLGGALSALLMLPVLSDHPVLYVLAIAIAVWSLVHLLAAGGGSNEITERYRTPDPLDGGTYKPKRLQDS